MRRQIYIQNLIKNIYLLLYRKLVFDLNQTNNELVSDGLLLILLTVFGFNVYSVFMLVLMNLKFVIVFIFFSVNFITFLIIYLNIRLMIAVERVMSSARLLFQTQPYLGAGQYFGCFKVKAKNDLLKFFSFCFYCRILRQSDCKVSF